MGGDGFEQAPLHVLDALASTVAIINSKQSNKIARLDLFDASSMVVLHVPSAPESEAVSPLHLDLRAVQQHSSSDVDMPFSTHGCKVTTWHSDHADMKSNSTNDEPFYCVALAGSTYAVAVRDNVSTVENVWIARSTKESA